MKPRYTSRYSGTEIDEILASVAGKISFDDIAPSCEGGFDKVASAESVRTLCVWKTQFDDPQFIEQLFLTINRSVIFTTDHLAILERLDRGYQGSFSDYIERQENVLTTDFVGGEISLILDNGAGLQSLEYWDAVTRTWKPAQWNGSLKGPDQNESSGGLKLVLKFNRFQANCVKFLIRSETNSDICVCEFTGVVKGSNTFWNVQGQIGTNPELVRVNRMYIDGDFVKVEVFLSGGSKTNFYKLAEF